MQIVGSFEAKTHFSSILAIVANGEEVFITKHGQVVAKMVPVAAISKSEIENAILAIKEFNKKHTLGNLDWKVLRDEGKR